MSNYDSRIARVTGQTFRKNAVVPPLGTDLTVFQDTDGSMKQVNSAGVKTALGGGASVSPAWQAAMFSYLKAKVSALATDAPLIDWIHGTANGTLEVTITGGTNNMSSAFSGGVNQCHPGAGASMFIEPVGVPIQVAGVKTVRWAIAGRLALQGPITANTTIHIGMFVVGHNGFVSLSLNPGTSLANWTLTTYDGAVAQFRATTTPLPALNTFVDFALMFDTAVVRAAVGQVQTTGMVDIAETEISLTRVPTQAGGLGTQVASAAVDDPFVLFDKLYSAFEQSPA